MFKVMSCLTLAIIVLGSTSGSLWADKIKSPTATAETGSPRCVGINAEEGAYHAVIVPCDGPLASYVEWEFTGDQIKSPQLTREAGTDRCLAATAGTPFFVGVAVPCALPNYTRWTRSGSEIEIPQLTREAGGGRRCLGIAGPRNVIVAVCGEPYTNWEIIH